MPEKGQEHRRQKPNKIILGRTLTLMLVCGVVAFIVLAARLYKIQISDHDYYEQKAVEQQTRETTVYASRGTIYDRNGNALAISATAATVFISPYEIQLYGEDVDLIARGLSDILGVEYDSIIEKSKDVKSWYKTVVRKIETELADQVRAFKSEHKLKGIYVEADSKRYYPYSNLACHIVGFVGYDNDGLEGIEARYDEYLTGVNGNIVRLSTARGTQMLFTNYEYYFDAEDGDSLELTIDVPIQYIAEKYLNQAIVDYGVQNGGSCIIMDVKTGEILALVSVGDYDLNNYLDVSQEVQEQLVLIEDEEERAQALSDAQFLQWRNKALSDTYEPGSVFKIITMAMALEEGKATKNSTYYCGGSVNVIGRKQPANCWKSAGHGSQTLLEAAQHSCNVAFVNIGLSVGAEVFYDYCEAFGLFEKTGLDISGEAASQWWTEDIFENPKNQSQLAAASFGQTFNITPIQMITAISATVNGGYLMKPYLVSKITDSEGNITVSNQPTVVRQVISEATSDTVCEILEAVVGKPGGTGKNAAVAGYRIGGKTGTSTKTSDYASTGEKEYLVSFCGVAPMNDPKIAVLLILDNPSASKGYVSGGVMAAPSVGKIFSEVLPYLGIEPDYTEEELKNLDVSVPKLQEKSVEDARAILEELSLNVRVVGEGDTVTAQLPMANAEVAAGTTVILYAGEEAPENMAIVPNLSGMTMQQARDALAARGLFMETSGALPTGSNVSVSGQSYAEGTEVPYGTVINATMIDSTQLGRY